MKYARRSLTPGFQAPGCKCREPLPHVPEHLLHAGVSAGLPSAGRGERRLYPKHVRRRIGEQRRQLRQQLRPLGAEAAGHRVVEDDEPPPIRLLHDTRGASRSASASADPARRSPLAGS